MPASVERVRVNRQWTHRPSVKKKKDPARNNLLKQCVETRHLTQRSLFIIRIMRGRESREPWPRKATLEQTEQAKRENKKAGNGPGGVRLLCRKAQQVVVVVSSMHATKIQDASVWRSNKSGGFLSEIALQGDSPGNTLEAQTLVKQHRQSVLRAP